MTPAKIVCRFQDENFRHIVEDMGISPKRRWYVYTKFAESAGLTDRRHYDEFQEAFGDWCKRVKKAAVYQRSAIKA